MHNDFVLALGRSIKKMGRWIRNMNINHVDYTTICKKYDLNNAEIDRGHHSCEHPCHTQPMSPTSDPKIAVRNMINRSESGGSFISFSASFLPVSSLSSASPLCARHVSSNLSPLTMALYQFTNVQRQTFVTAALVGREVPFFMRQCTIESQLQPPRQQSRCSAPLFFCQ
ncbi:hypothetical protein BDZ97DRAFT_1892000 [Flammula alnicola]|nr:hypothetical protein BDZ97DRAFT_1892000 [Flammula alnicola]